MTSAENTSNRPIYAEMGATTTTGTSATLTIFGKSVQHIFTGNDHHSKAVVWVNEWNAHLASEWMTVLGIMASLLDDFSRALRNHGVSDTCIIDAIEEIRAHAKG